MVETPKTSITCVHDCAVYLAFLALIGTCCVVLAQVLMPAQSVILHLLGRLNWLLLLAVLPIHRTPAGHYHTGSCTALATQQDVVKHLN